jgi:hypothetical protein
VPQGNLGYTDKGVLIHTGKKQSLLPQDVKTQKILWNNRLKIILDTI